MSDSLSSEDDAPGPVEFEREHEFMEQLARLIPDAVRRLGFLENGIERAIVGGLGAVRSGRDGMLLTEPGFYGVPEVMVWYYVTTAPHHDREVIVLDRIVEVPEISEIEDDT